MAIAMVNKKNQTCGGESVPSWMRKLFLLFKIKILLSIFDDFTELPKISHRDIRAPLVIRNMTVNLWRIFYTVIIEICEYQDFGKFKCSKDHVSNLQPPTDEP